MARGGTSSRPRQTTHGSSPEAGTGKADETRQDKKNNRVPLVTAFVGLITAVIGLGAAVVPLLSQIDGLRQQIHAQAASISSQSSQIGKLRAAQTVPNAPEDGGSYLSNMTPISDRYGYNAQGGPVIMSRIQYPDSVTFNCAGVNGTDAPLSYLVSGTEFTAVIGYSDATPYADAHVKATITITDQTGKLLGDLVEVTPGHALRVRLPLSGVTELGFTCTSANTLAGGAELPWPGPAISLANASE
jgi:hypothetical protein